MSVQTFKNDVAGASSANAVANPKWVWIDGRKIVVFTGADIPFQESAVPQSVTRFQALAALELAGKLTAVEVIINNVATPKLTKLAWDNALSFERTSPTLNALATQIGMTAAEIDALFIAAAGITA